METIFFGVAGFTIVIVALVLILMAARAQLVQSGDVRILINGDPDKAIKTAVRARINAPKLQGLMLRVGIAAVASAELDRVGT